MNTEHLRQIAIKKNIDKAHRESLEKLNSIQSFYNTIFEDTDEVTSIQNKLNKFVSEFQEHNNKFTELHNTVFGYTETNEDEEDKTHIGELDKAKNKFDKYQKQYDTLFTQIEGLLSGATTTSLSKNFDDKVREYKDERIKWEGNIFKFLLVLFLISIGFAVFIAFNKDIEQSMIYTIGMPVYSFSIWIMIFMGNRRAESRKLEESFKHKFLMAKSFVGYKKSITDIATNEDNKLMEIHMNNLLNAMSKDSSKFFEIKGESHPVADFFKKSKKELDPK